MSVKTEVNDQGILFGIENLLRSVIPDCWSSQALEHDESDEPDGSRLLWLCLHVQTVTRQSSYSERGKHTHGCTEQHK